MASIAIVLVLLFSIIIQTQGTENVSISKRSNLSDDGEIFAEPALTQEERDNILELLKQRSKDYSDDTMDRKQPARNGDSLENILNPEGITAAKRFLLQFVDSWFTSNNISASTECVRDLKSLISGALALKKWALPFLDASGKPGPSLTEGWLDFVGNYDQCRDAAAPPLMSEGTPRFKGDYCVLSLTTLDILPSSNLALCLPQTCSEFDIKRIGDEILRSLRLNRTFDSIDCLNGDTEVTTATVLAIISLAVFGILVILGTGYDLIYVQTWIWVGKEESSTNGRDAGSNGFNSKPNNYETISNSNEDSNSAIGKISRKANFLLAFSAYTNGRNILRVKHNTESLMSVHGLRYLSICWVVLGHTYLNALTYTVNKTTVAPRYVRRWTFDTIANAFLSVDTFFALSGLLTAYHTFKEMEKKGWKINWPLFYFHRFWRLTPPYMFVIVISLGLTQYIGEGPLWRNEQPVDKRNCEHNWWRNLLYINNFHKFSDLCMAQSWYLPNDMQFYCVSPLMLVPLFMHRVLGLVTCLAILSASWIVTFVLSAVNHWLPVVITVDLTPEEKTEWNDDFYIKPYCRIGPYIIGILAGYLLAQIKGKGNCIRMKWWVAVLGWALATGSALSIVYGLRGEISGDHPISNGVSALYNATARTAWGAVICWIVIACDAGYGGPVNIFLSWSPFVVLGRMTYMIYLLHVYVLNIFYQNMGAAFFTNTTTLVIFFVGALTFTNFASFFFMLFFESPFISMEKAFLPQKKGK